jgi:hypothetical protein
MIEIIEEFIYNNFDLYLNTMYSLIVIMIVFLYKTIHIYDRLDSRQKDDDKFVE